MNALISILSGLAVFAFLILGCAATTEVTGAALGQEVSLAAGQTVEISGEDIKIKFLEITEDSRCPTGAVCVWAGQASASVKVTKDKVTTNILLTEPGESSERTQYTYQNYTFSFRIEPYPEVDKPIDATDYRLLLTVTKTT